MNFSDLTSKLKSFKFSNKDFRAFTEAFELLFNILLHVAVWVFLIWGIFWFLIPSAINTKNYYNTKDNDL